MNNRIKNKIRKLLSLANDQQSTPEGDAALSRAMEMMAQYGVNRDDVEDTPVDTTLDITVIDISGYKYAKQQHYLIDRIARALNCRAVGNHGGYRKSVSTVSVAGRAVDRERVLMLFSVASPAMIASSVIAVPAGSYRVRLHRLSHMLGYADAIKDSLTGHEENTRSQHGDSQAVILADAANAQRLMDETFGNVRSTGSSYSPGSYQAGYNEGSNFDTGNNARLGGSRALSA